jgi:hypothetical protein
MLRRPVTPLKGCGGSIGLGPRATNLPVRQTLRRTERSPPFQLLGQTFSHEVSDTIRVRS